MLACAVLALALSLPSQTAPKKPLDPSVFDGWNSIRGTALSRDGKWLTYSITPQEGDAAGWIRSLDDGHTISVPRANLRFTKDSKFAVGISMPPFADTRKARREKAKPDDMPKGALVIVNLATGEQTRIEKVQSFDLPREDSGWIVYKPAPPKPEPPAKDAKETKAEEKATPWAIRNLGSGKEETIPNATRVTFNKEGNVLAYSLDSKDDKDGSVTYEDLSSGKKSTVVTGKLEFPQIDLSNDGRYLAYLSKPVVPKPKEKAKDETPKAPPTCSLTLFDPRSGKAGAVGADSMPKGWSVNEKSSIRFSERGARLVYATSPAPLAPPKEVPDDEKVSLDVWTWQDRELQPAQILRAEAERNRGYTAIYDIGKKRSMQLADRDLPTVQISDKDDGRYAEASTDLPYEHDGAWDPGYEDVFLIDLQDGRRYQVASKLKCETRLSPKGHYLALFDGAAKSWAIIDCATRASHPVTTIPYPLADELNDVPDVPNAYGLAGWTKDDKDAILQDRYDLWQVPTDGKSVTRRLTYGRDVKERYSVDDLDPEDPTVDPNHMLLTGLNDDSKEGGAFWLANGSIQKELEGPKIYGGFEKAKDSDRLVYTQQDFVEYPDLWVTDTAFHSPQKVTDANPQQKEYNWGKAELVRWTSLDGVPLQGILIKPENFDYTKKYPLIAYFYERLSDSLYSYHPPAPSASTINLSYFASNGYCIFVPDIPYRVGYPGYSALSAIVPGVQSIVERGYIDPKRLGIQGQSWGGYQVAYLVTQTNMFAAAEAGAPVGDMFSAYGGIRYGSGIVREMQYEHGQSRIGGTPWDATLRFIENSPVFFADKVQTPLMIMSNDKDGAVPHTQGIELFTALRRLNKPSWMVVYNGEDHNIMERKNRKDFTIRLSQFFDHFLKGAPEPVWMAKGIPAVDKGRTMGLDPATP
ncbi:MAG TPA: prolyl oligopeptidase family serine peptidase [Fimbriimonas sp.]|nr:prolyl oligopeptidase family serine peptidase [Fimbriimonas sp.]